MQKGVKKKGFTLVELTLAMAFISVLSIIIAAVIMNAVSSYRRGITLNQVNTVGLELVENVRTAIKASPARALKEDCTELYTGSTSSDDTLAGKCVKDGGRSLVTFVRKGRVKLANGTTIDNAPLYGAFCTGKYTYLWNSGYFFSADEGVEISMSGMTNWSDTTSQRTDMLVHYQFADYGASVADESSTTFASVNLHGFRMMRIIDEDRTACKVVAGYKPSEANGGEYRSFDKMADNTGSAWNNVFTTNEATREAEMNRGAIYLDFGLIDEHPEDLLNGDEFTSLVLYDLEASTPAKPERLNSAFYSVSFILGTKQGGVNIDKSTGNCISPTDNEENNAQFEAFDYCAINKFNFAAQAIGG